MTCSELFRQLLDSCTKARFDWMPVTVLAGPASHPRSRHPQSPQLSSIDPSNQQLQSVPAAQNAGRRVAASAGATPVFVAVIRHDTSLARRVSLVGRSRTCPYISTANRRPADSTSQE